MKNDPHIVQILNNPLSNEHWPSLELIIKDLNDYIAKSTKNRNYIEAQKAKQKIVEANAQIRKRNISEIQYRLKRSVSDLQKKHEEESKKFELDYQNKLKKMVYEHKDLLAKKSQRHQEEETKHYQQIELALPHNHSPDRDLHKLKWEEQQYAREGKFIEAQKVKERIDQREIQLNQKHQKLRQNNISIMMNEVRLKHEQEINLIETRFQQKCGELQKQKKKKVKELQMKQQLELKQLKWIYNEELRKYA